MWSESFGRGSNVVLGYILCVGITRISKFQSIQFLSIDQGLLAKVRIFLSLYFVNTHDESMIYFNQRLNKKQKCSYLTILISSTHLYVALF